MNKIDLKRLTQYIEEGWIEFQDHPSLPLRIYNYSRNCQFESYWDDLTLMCRGLILDYDGNIVARPFRKFFNMEENKHTPTTDFDVYEKMDGSLGILFYYKEEWILATRGSFTSEQSIKGKEIFDRYVKEYGDENLNVNLTYLTEIIYPENNPLPRNSFSCGQSKQAVSVYHSNYQMRIDKMGVILNYGQIPLIKSRYLEYINNEEQPYGVNAIVAIMSYTGYNVEDAILINEGSVARGIFRTTYYSMYESREESSKVSGMINSKFASSNDKILTKG
jgi:hypothetical protein